MAGGLSFPTKVGLDGLLIDGVLGGEVQELLCYAQGLVAERVNERLTGHATDEGLDHVGVGDVGELIVLLREALNVLPEGLLGPVPIVADVPRVPWAGVGTLEVADEDRTEVALAADAAGLELLELSSGRA